MTTAPATRPAQSSSVGHLRAVPSQFRRQVNREVYTVAEVSELLGLALGGAYELVRDGTIPARKLGGRWVISKKRFHAWLDGMDQEENA